ncbi:hypothetical protein [Herbiconiux ginsengi]|uniref:Uncharacterized protein n=1 Tax=Herbiconiux ginsengi TaxID=381665 RepID=A0A1H3RLN6_9MICO|nr:hypothetical protein [Herbiconiux ginsengi]SDZ26275.1 hypothetical protein SAMN05216554_2889 [Herbiconiux ginsengi]
MRPLTKSSAAEWVAAGTDHWKLTIEGFVPAEYEAYARVLHEIEQGGEHATWVSVAAANGRPFGPLAQWTRINVDPDGQEWHDRPRVGTLTPSVAHSLSEVLAAFTITPATCFFGVWEGFGGSELPPDIQLFKSNTRVMGLFEGPLQDATHSFSAWPGSQLANLWWPADRAWFVVSEIDSDRTIVAGSRACIDALLRAPGLEVFEVGQGDTLAIS